jgi:hypothetical protein
MIAILLAALLAAATFGSALVLADSAVRGRNAFRLLRGQQSAGLEGDRRLTVRFVDLAARPALPALRPRGFSPARPVRRPAPSLAPSLPAAA